MQKYFKQTQIVNLRCLDSDYGVGSIFSFLDWSGGLTSIKTWFVMYWWILVASGSMLYLIFNENVISQFEVQFLPFLGMDEDYAIGRYMYG